MGKICRLYEIVIRDMILLLLERDGFFSDFGPFFFRDICNVGVGLIWILLQRSC